MNVILCEYPIRLMLSAVRAGQGTAVIQHDSAHDTFRYLRSLTMRPGATAELRELLGKTGARPQQGTEDVLREVASRVAAKQLYVLQASVEPAGNLDGEAAAPPPGGKRGPVSPPPPLPPPVKSATRGASSAAEPEPTAALQQDVQARSMESAAADGTPFCAVCEQAAAAREKRAPA